MTSFGDIEIGVLGQVATMVLAASMLSLVLSRLMIQHAWRFGLMDQPDERRIHSSPIPRAGGLAIWLSFVIVTTFTRILWPSLIAEKSLEHLNGFLIAGSILILVGVLDDRSGLRPVVKLGGQLLASATYFLYVPPQPESFFGVEIPGLVLGLAFVGWSVLLINSFNLIDGLDGLCGGLAAISLVFVGIVSGSHHGLGSAVVLFIMVAAVAGFLRYNIHPARIFLGDAGSMLLGLFIATAATSMGGRRAIVGSLLVPVAIAGVPLLDVILAIWRRTARGLVERYRGKGSGKLRVFSPDKDHLHHRLLHAGLSQRKVAALLHGIAILFAAIAVMPMLAGERAAALAIGAFLLVILFGLRHFARIELIETGSLLHFSIKRPSQFFGKRRLYFVFDLMAALAAVSCGFLLERGGNPASWSFQKDLQFGVFYVVAMLVTMQLLGVYSRVWARAHASDFFQLFFGLFVGTFLSVACFHLIEGVMNWEVTRAAIIATFILGILVISPRALPELVRAQSIACSHKDASRGREVARVVIYGAGDLGNLLLKYLSCCRPNDFHGLRVVGFVDDNPKLKGRKMGGFAVLGGHQCIDKLACEGTIDGVVIAISKIDEERLEEVRMAVANSGLALFHWNHDFAPQSDPFLRFVPRARPQAAQELPPMPLGGALRPS